MTTVITQTPEVAQLDAALRDVAAALAGSRSRLAAIPAERDRARRSGEAGQVLLLDVEAEDLAAEVAALELQQAELAERRRVASEAALRAHHTGALERKRQQQTQLRMQIRAHAIPIGQDMGALRRVNEEIGELEAALAGNPELKRAAILRDADAWIQVFAETLVSYLHREPATSRPDRAFLDCFTDGAGDAMRAAFESFFGGGNGHGR